LGLALMENARRISERANMAIPSKACQIKKKQVVTTPLKMPFSDYSTPPEGDIEKRLVASPVQP